MMERTAWWNLLKDEEAQTISDVGILGFPYDATVCYRKGAALAPAKIRELSRTSAAITESGRAIGQLRVTDFGDVIPGQGDSARPEKYIEQAVDHLKTIKSPPSFLLCLGGDHSILIPVSQWIQERGISDWGVIHIDAHPDLFSIYENSPLSHATALRRTLELPNFHPQRCAMIGARSFSPFETEFIQTMNMPLTTAKQMQEKGTAVVVDEICDLLQGLDHVLVSLDIDAVDPAFAPGTGIPVAGGLSSRDLLTITEGFIKRLPVDVLCLVEIAPPLDVSDITSFLGTQVVMEIFGQLDEKVCARPADH